MNETKVCYCEFIHCDHGEKLCTRTADQSRDGIIFLGRQICSACIETVRTVAPEYLIKD